MTSEICAGSQKATVKGVVVEIEEKRPWQRLWVKTRVLKLEINHPSTPIKRFTVFDNGNRFKEARIGSTLDVEFAHATEGERYFFGTRPTTVLAVS